MPSLIGILIMIQKFLQNKPQEIEMLVISIVISKLPFKKGLGIYSAINTHSHVPIFPPESQEFFSYFPFWISCFYHVTYFYRTCLLTEDKNFIHGHCNYCWHSFVYIPCLLLRCSYLRN